MDNVHISPDLSPWGMFLNADPVVQGILIGLVFASVITWTVWFAKSIELFFAKRQVRSALQNIANLSTLADAAAVSLSKNNPVAQFIETALTELKLSEGLIEQTGIKERIASRFQRIEAAFGRRITFGTGMLASIGATAPFVGLLGTVWGIMNSFIGISKHHTTNLAVVAPGIAEALLTTAIGLAAAIPAVLIYNVFARAISGYRIQLTDASAAVMRLVSRDLDKQHITKARPLAAE